MTNLVFEKQTIVNHAKKRVDNQNVSMLYFLSDDHESEMYSVIF